MDFSTDLVPDGGERVFEREHQDPEIDVGALEADFVRAGQVARGDDVEEPEGFFLGQKEQEQAGEEVQRLAVADAGMVDGEGAEDAAEGGEQGGFGGWGVGRIGLEVEVVREGAVEVSFYGFLVVGVEFRGLRLEGE